MIKINNLTFDYDHHRALYDINLAIEAHSITALVGPNGSGKTTLMRCIAGLETPLVGSIFVEGIDVLNTPRKAHEKIGYLSDSFGLYKELTVYQCLTYAAYAHKVPAKEVIHAVRAVAEQLDLTPKLHQRTLSLSRGQRQRVAIGQAIIHKPSLLILDEPASGLDPEQRSNLALVFKKLQKDGITLLVSSHILAELDEYSTHILALRNGRIIDHQSLNTLALERKYRISVLEPAINHAKLIKILQADNAPESMHSILQLISQVVTQDSVTDPAVFFESNADDAEIAALLRYLMDQDVPITAFHPYQDTLQATYLRSLAKSTH